MRLEIVEAGLLEYGEALALQKDMQAKRIAAEIPDTLILLEHPPVITLGRRAENADVLISPALASRLGISIIRTERGGEVTYHGPGQLVGYPICDIGITRGSIKGFVHLVEEALILTLEKEWGLRAGRRKEYIGVWVGEEKIAAIGFSVSRRVTMHGFALNVNTNLDHFKWIVPCGMRTGAVTSLQTILGREIPMEDVKTRVARGIKEVFGYE
ncbi:MAG: lipoyl(octanoyl) transferase LipB [Spirochaetales bacterium]|jgi:lipoyl(octanoyl) transferase|nr:lipoyl(octanoyl) transferase LipB [Spirochaetales bacterium]